MKKLEFVPSEIQCSLSRELIDARSQQADAEMRNEEGFEIMQDVLQALNSCKSYKQVQLFRVFLTKSINLCGLAQKAEVEVDIP